MKVIHRPGRIIVLEGLPNGCGKSSTAKALFEIMDRANHKTLLFRDPGDTAVGERVRAIVKDPHVPVRPLTQMLLYTAARSELAHEIEPFVLEGGHVILDRWWHSTVAYQGRVSGVDTELIMHLVNHTTPSLCRFDHRLAFFLDVPIETCMERSGALRPGGSIENGGDRFESQGIAFQKKLREGYFRLVQTGRMRLIKYNASSPGEMAEWLYKTYIERELN